MALVERLKDEFIFASRLEQKLETVITDEGSKPEILSRIAQATAALTRLKQFGMRGAYFSVARYD